MPPFEPFTHVQQITLGYCLPACGQMALAQLGITVTQAELAHALGTRVGVVRLFRKWSAWHGGEFVCN